MSKEICIVEDDLIARMSFEEEVKDMGYEHIYLAKNDEQFFDIISTKNVDVILMDVFLKNSLKGTEIISKLREEVGYIPTIYITGSSDPSTVEEMLRTKPEAILNKPIDFSHLRNTLLTTLAKGEERFENLNPDRLLGLIYDTAQIGMCVTDKDGIFVKVNKAYCRTYGYKESELIGQSFTKVLPPEHREYGQTMHDKFIHEKILELPAEWQVQAKNGDVKDVFVTAGYMENDEGESFKVTTVSDITERKKHIAQLEKTLKERNVLERETFHRVKNNLNMLVSLFQLQLGKAEDDKIKDTLQSGIARIKSLSILHDKLYKKEDLHKVDLQEYVSTICDYHLQGNLEGYKINAAFNIASAVTDIDTAIALGLIVNELMTNIVKHALTDNHREIDVEVKIATAEKDLVLSVSDSGQPLPDGFDPDKTNSLGFQMIQALTEQLDGAFSFEQAETNKNFSIRFSLDQGGVEIR